jgi:3D (Asp-Asp-Asp) domain-containing protein
MRTVASRALLLTTGLFVAGCSSTRPLPKYEKPLARAAVMSVRTTAYTHTEADHVQYANRNALGGCLQCGPIHSAAADWSRWPAGTLFRIEETGELYQVDDYGWALAGTNTIDLYKPDRSSMNDWGVRRVHIEIQQWGDRHHSLSVLSGRTKYAHVRRMVAGLESDSQPFEPLSAPTLTPPIRPVSPAIAIENAPRAELVSTSIRKPFRP